MEHCAKWIWYYGDYELFHSNLVNSRREEKGDAYPPFIALPSIHTNVGFEKRVHLDAPTKIHVVANGQLQVKIDNLPRHSEDSVFTIPQGEHTIIIYVCNLFGLPAAYIDGEVIYSDELGGVRPFLRENSRRVYSRLFFGIGRRGKVSVLL